MLKVLRHKGVAKKVLWFVAVIIIISFGFLGQAYLLKQDKQARYAGRVFGKKVSLAEFAKEYQMAQVNALIQHGDKFWELRDVLNLEAQAWDRIILLHEAKKRRIKVSNEDVIQAIREYPFFQRDGKYDHALYNAVLANVFRIKPRDFEEGVRGSLMIARLFEQETLGVHVTEDEIRQAYTRKNEKVQVSYVFFPAEDYTDQVTFDEIKAKEFFLKNKDLFMTPEKIKVEYIKIPYPAAEGDDVSEEAKDDTFAKALDAAYLLNEGTDWDQVASEYDTTVTVSDFFSMEQPDLKLGSYEVIQTVFELKDGQISDPLETDTGYIIARIKQRQQPYVPDYTSVQDKVKEAWIKTKAKDIAGEKAKAAYTAIKEAAGQFKNPDFAKIAKDLGFEIRQTPMFSRQDYLPTIGISRDFMTAAFSLTKENPLSQAVPVAKGWAVLYLDQRQQIDEKQYEKDKDKTAREILFEKKSRVFSEFLGQLRLRSGLVDLISKRKEEGKSEQF